MDYLLVSYASAGDETWQLELIWSDIFEGLKRKMEHVVVSLHAMQTGCNQWKHTSFMYFVHIYMSLTVFFSCSVPDFPCWAVTCVISHSVQVIEVSCCHLKENIHDYVRCLRHGPLNCTHSTILLRSVPLWTHTNTLKRYTAINHFTVYVNVLYIEKEAMETCFSSKQHDLNVHCLCLRQSEDWIHLLKWKYVGMKCDWCPHRPLQWQQSDHVNQIYTTTHWFSLCCISVMYETKSYIHF